MQTLNVTDTEIDLTTQVVPFLQGYDVIAVNASAASITLQSSDTTGSGFTTLATIAAGESAKVNLDQQFIKLSAAGNLILLGN